MSLRESLLERVQLGDPHGTHSEKFGRRWSIDQPSQEGALFPRWLRRTILANPFFLRSTWRRLTLCILVIPIAILKNGLRIVTRSTLAIDVNPGFLHGNLHHQGGIVFFVIALLPMALILVLLQTGENPRAAVT